MYGPRVLVLLALLVGFAHCFKWEIVVAGERQLYFYYNNTLTYTQEIPLVTGQITSVTYDPVHYRVLFSDVNKPNMSIFSYDITTKTTQSLLTTKTEDRWARVVYDPATQLLVWKDILQIYKFSVNPTSSNNALHENNLVTLDNLCRDIAVDSCGGYIYWITDDEIARVRLDGSEREVVISSTVYYRLSLAIDQQTQRLYWIEKKYLNGIDHQSIESSNFNGKNKTTLYTVTNVLLASTLAISKDSIYWQDYNNVFEIRQLPKNSSEHVTRKLYSITRIGDIANHLVVANYTIQEQIQGIKNCKALQDLNSKPESTVSICPNYCLEGDCSVSAEGKLECSCKAGYSGKRCEINACHQYCLHNGVCSLNEEDEPSCVCTADYEGERCDVAITRAGDCADTSTQQVLRDLRSGVKQALKEELKRILLLFSDKLDGDEDKC